MKKGSLLCSTIKFPNEFHHSYGWKPIEISSPTISFIYFWSDGTSFYMWHGGGCFVFNDNTWEKYTPVFEDGFNGTYGSLYGSYIWTDGTHIYYSDDESNHYVLDGDVWRKKTWNGSQHCSGDHIWSDGTSIYFTNGWTNVLNGDTWEAKTWSAKPSKAEAFRGEFIWGDGTNIYHSAFRYGNSAEYVHYVLNGDAWEEVTWNGFSNFRGTSVWCDGKNIYIADDYVLRGKTWKPVAWSCEGSAFTLGVPTSDGTDIYWFSYKGAYTLVPTEPLDPKSMLQGWLVGRRIAGNR